MTTSVERAILAIVTMLMLTNVSAYAQDFSDSRGPLWSSAGRHIQLTGKVICAGCTLEEARKIHPDIPDTRLYVVNTDHGQMVTELSWISNPQWRDRLTTPHVVQLRADGDLLQKIFAKELTLRDRSEKGVNLPI